MALFVHLAPEKEIREILRRGIRPRRLKYPLDAGLDRAVYAMPSTDRYHVSHQWARELKRKGQRTLVAVYFRLPDDQPVWVGRYNGPHDRVTAVEAVGLVHHAEQPAGLEVIIPRKVLPKEIRRIAAVSPVMGWRYHPDAKGRRPCGCPWCTKGDIRSRRLRARDGEDPASP